MPARWHVNSELRAAALMERIRSELAAGRAMWLEEIPEKRTLDQNAISHAWYAEISKIKQDESPLCVKCQSKLHCGVPILRAEDDGFREFYDTAIKKALTYEQKLEAMKFIPVTSLMSKGQLTQYLEAMQIYWRRDGIYLEFPGDAELHKYPEAAA